MKIKLEDDKGFAEVEFVNHLPRNFDLAFPKRDGYLIVNFIPKRREVPEPFHYIPNPFRYHE